MIANSSKGRNLLKVKGQLKHFTVPDFLLLETDAFERAPATILERVSAHFHGQRVAVRSSASDEDGLVSAMAGEYESVLSVDADDTNALQAAIRQVIESYRRNGARAAGEEVFVQQMVSGVSMSGVIFTHDLNTGAPYYVVNYDDESGTTDAVTSGGEYSNRTLYIHRGALDSLRSERFQSLLQAVCELENFVGSQFLDVEFALGTDFHPYLLQVRAITTQPNWNRGISSRINAALTGIQTFLRDRLKPIPGVYGRTTVLGQMPDWNPAEMIGRAPRALAHSLYRHLITDHAWRDGRTAMGYAVPEGQPLMVSLAGQPFIDTRLSFHSYLPAGLPSSIAEKLVDAWVERLRNHPELHDKVEFEVAITTYSFDIDSKLDRLAPDVLTAQERELFKQLSRAQLRGLLQTNSAGSVASAMEKVRVLEARQSSAQRSATVSLLALHGMLEECQRDGTIPFAILARHGFIAKTLLNSLQALSILDANDLADIYGGITTVAGDLVDWMRQLQDGSLSRERFMARFGHLRPGTYDILSRRYDQMPELAAAGGAMRRNVPKAVFRLSDDKRRSINALLQREGFPGFDADALLAYVNDATVGREYGKLIFTRTVSDALELIADFGERHGLSREELSHVPLACFLDAATSSGEIHIEDRLRSIAKQEVESHMLSVAIRLPQVLSDEAGVHVIPFQVSMPNFITHKEVTAPAIALGQDGLTPRLIGKIVLIENADPGFDWIFSEEIAGLITKYGGANSHMAIRCAEFGIPAAIGCGEQRFETLLQASHVSLDCSAGTINPFH
jgi:hypothetical protein